MKLWSWGANTNGQLGHGFASEQVSRPLQVQTESISKLLLFKDAPQFEESALVHLKNSPRPFLEIHGGGTQVLLCVSKALEGWEGSSSILLQLGSGSPGINNKPSNSQVKQTVPSSPHLLSSQFQPKLISEELDIKSISCGWDFNLLVTQNNKVYSWGENKYGQLGRESDSHDSQSRLEFLTDFTASRVSAGLRHAAAVGTDGCLYLWGDNTKSQLGLSSSDKIIRKPTKLIHKGSCAPQFVDVRCGKSFTIALDSEGQLWGCGSNKFGQLGCNLPFVTELTKVPLTLPVNTVNIDACDLSTVPIKQFECGWNHVLVLLDNGKLVSWGRDNFNQLGRSIQTKLQVLSSNLCDAEARFEREFDPEAGYVEYIYEVIESIACGSEHNLILGASGTVYSWGWNEHENCGVKSSRMSTSEGNIKIGEDCVVSPTIVRFPDQVGKILQIGCGAGNGFALSEL